MKIVFEGSELKEGIIKVSLDGGFTFADYEIADVKESGIPLDDSQRYDKIKNTYKNLCMDLLQIRNPSYIYKKPKSRRFCFCL